MDEAPSNAYQHQKRFQENTRVEGHGIGNVWMHVPCPFCAAPDFMVYELLTVEQAMMNGATCKECGRSAAALFCRTPGTTTFEVVQTGGPPQPEWLEPKMRRLPS